jgi:DDE superfamily endonuclease
VDRGRGGTTYQTTPYPGASWQPIGEPKRRPHEYVRRGTAKLLSLFHPATGEVRVRGVRRATNEVLHPWLREEFIAILETLPQPKEALSAEHNRSEWKSWQEGLSVKITLPEELPPLRMLLVWDNLIGHLNAELLLWMFARGIMVLYTPLGGSWLNMTESIQRILVRRALSGEHPRRSPSRSWSGWRRRRGDGTGIRRRLSGAVGALCDECALESGGILWEVAEPAREG